MAYVPFTDALRSIMLADAGLSALVGTRIYPDILPQNPVLPAITIQQLTSDVYDNIQGYSGLEKAYMQIDVWAKTATSRNTVAEALRLAICGYTGIQSGVKIQGIRLESRLDLHEPEIDNYRKVNRFEVWHREANPSRADNN